jgi:hypothetical protein
MVTNVSYKSYIIFTAINLAAIPMVYFFFPETARLPPEAVDLLFSPGEDGKQLSIFRAVRNSTNKDSVAAMTFQQDENTASDMKIVELETLEQV